MLLGVIFGEVSGPIRVVNFNDNIIKTVIKGGKILNRIRNAWELQVIVSPNSPPLWDRW